MDEEATVELVITPVVIVARCDDSDAVRDDMIHDGRMIISRLLSPLRRPQMEAITPRSGDINWRVSLCKIRAILGFIADLTYRMHMIGSQYHDARSI
jgi:hypothetical protein